MIKYRLTDEKMSTNLELAAYRIIALRDFGNVKAGDLGGFVESESNLSHDGNCWIDEDSIVVYDSIVRGDAQISYSEIWNGSTIEGSATVFDSIISGQSIKISGGNIKESTINGRDVTIQGGIINKSTINNNVFVDGGVIEKSNISNCCIYSGDTINFDVDNNNFHTVIISYGKDERLNFTIDCSTGLIHGCWKPMTISKYLNVLKSGGFDKNFISSLSLTIRSLQKLKTIKPTFH